MFEAFLSHLLTYPKNTQGKAAGARASVTSAPRPLSSPSSFGGTGREGAGNARARGRPGPRIWACADSLDAGNAQFSRNISSPGRLASVPGFPGGEERSQSGDQPILLPWDGEVREAPVTQPSTTRRHKFGALSAKARAELQASCLLLPWCGSPRPF